MLDNGKIIIRKVGACTYGWNPKVRESTSEIDTKGIGSMALEMDMVSSTMPMVRSTKVIGNKT